MRVDLPAGTYSDDTQLRLAVCRSIRGDGSFDAETFAKIEVTVWPTYALGGGLGTKAAATNLGKRSVNWFSNFFEVSGQSYVKGGGNGAAMRIQPHVWNSLSTTDEMLVSVLQDSLVTHGHPHGFCGALFHALCLSYVFVHQKLPGVEDWNGFVVRFSDVPRLIAYDPQLAAFWLSTWEAQSGASLQAAMLQMQDEAIQDVRAVDKLLQGSGAKAYRDILDSIGCLTPKFRGSGFKTALAAAALARLCAKEMPQHALILAANELDSDTDTIATMAGALLGALSSDEPRWAIQDKEYIAHEAERLALISLGEPQDSFDYPDLGRWTAPARQTASVGRIEGKIAIAGLGFLAPLGEEYRTSDAVWQWFSLPFGQSILAKRRANEIGELAPSQMPGPRQPAPQRTTRAVPREREAQTSLPLDSVVSRPVEAKRGPESRQSAIAARDTLDAWTDAVIQSDFDDLTLGRLLNRCIERSSSIDSAVAFAAIVAKAKLARMRRRR
ncbi:ADP-ribosylglycohydrolase [Sphingomonas jinjuensis]|uniref:ADP-ribosylglycohydrolase n=1 Tax=Sphingomonas jinjuensis TaxID=535907 RepID=A0A840F4N5_9SPHN|nr:ADP-ribosylglycohydrolase [Sphingomonas jinjuensis]